MFGYPGNNKPADKDLSGNQQFYPVHAKIIHFSFVLSIYTECGGNTYTECSIKVACSIIK